MKYIKSFEDYLKESMEIDITGKLSMPDYLEDCADDDENDAYDKGAASAHNDVELFENPYSDEELKYAWETGFKDALKSNMD
jgi:hypothetical protein